MSQLPLAGVAPPTPVAVRAKGAWDPMKFPVFRALWLATVVSNIGTWAQEAGGPWLMRYLHNDPLLVGLVQTASNLSICLLSLFAGALADMLDRRRLLLFTQIWMLIAAGALGVLTCTGHVTPVILLLLTFILGIGTALSGPPFQAIVPELVPPGDMPLAVSLNSVALNVARAVGPALTGLVIALAIGLRMGGPGKSDHERFGTGLSFVVNAISFVGVAWVLWRWRRAPQTRPIHPERVFGAMRLGVRYARHSPALRAVLVRVAVFIFCACAMWSQMAVIAGDYLHQGPNGYTMLMAFLGVGAIGGVFLMPPLQRRLSIDGMVVACTAMFAAGLLTLSFHPPLWVACGLMVFLGINWVIIPTNFNIATQRSVPQWVKGRALAMYLMTLSGSWALGALFWGAMVANWASHFHSKETAIALMLRCVAGALAAGLLVAWRFRLTRNAGADLRPARHWPRPAISADADHGPVLVTIEYEVLPQEIAEFSSLMYQLKRQRLRDGAHHWALYDAAATPGRVIETFLVASWAEHLRQHERITYADKLLEDRALSFHQGHQPPVVSHFLHRGAGLRQMAGAAGAMPNASNVGTGTQRRWSWGAMLLRLQTRLRTEYEMFRRRCGCDTVRRSRQPGSPEKHRAHRGTDATEKNAMQ